MPLDAYDMKPEGMIAYLRYNGWHFNKKACEWAVSQMRKYNPVTKKDEEVDYMDKDKVESILTKQGVTLENNVGYDHVYVANMVKADFYKSSIEDEAHMALFVKDMVDDTASSLTDSMPIATIMASAFHGMIFYDKSRDISRKVRLESSCVLRFGIIRYR